MMSVDPLEELPAMDIQKLRQSLRLGLAVVTEIWSYPTTDWISSVHAADIDGDGDIEVLIGSRDGWVYALTRLGKLKWKIQCSNEWVGTVFAIDRKDAQSETRIIAGSRDNKVYGLSETGHYTWESPYSTELVARHIYLKDINQDGKVEVIVGSEDRCIHVLESESGELLWKYTTDAWVRSVYASDIDNDGKVEILGGSGDKNVYVLDNLGNLKQCYDIGSKTYALFVADLDQDGTNEILISSDSKELYAFSPDGKKKWTYKSEDRILSIFAVDLNNDGLLEVIAGSEDKHLYILNGQGELLWKHRIGSRVFSVFAIDLERDGLWEILVGAEDSSIHVLRVELTDGLQKKILKSYQALGSPLYANLALSPTESSLLQVLTSHLNTFHEVEQPYLLKNTMNLEDRLQHLSTLLERAESKVQQLWVRQIGYIRTMDLGHITDNTSLEIIVGTGEGNVHVVDHSGSVLWSKAFGDRIRAIQIGDIDQDGDIEVLAGSIDGQIHALSRDGQTIKWQYTMGGNWITSISIDSVTEHDHTKIVMGSENKSLSLYTDSLTTEPETIATPQGILIVSLADINNDGLTEIVAGAADDGHVYAYTFQGELLWQHKTNDRIRTLCVVDIDADGLNETIVGSEDRTVYVLDNRGNLKWRYYTAHRVLDVTAMDVDQDGHVEVLLGVGDGYVYILSSEGDLLWRYLVNDRVRVIRAADIDQDGSIEIIVGSEDRLYLLRALNVQNLQQEIKHCWNEIQQHFPAGEMLTELAQHPNPIVRAFALKKFSEQPDLLLNKLHLLQSFADDPLTLIRSTFAHSIPLFYQAYPEYTRRFLDVLSSGDRKRDVRLALVDSLPEIVQIDRELGFSYLDRFTRNVDLWVRRAVVRKLHGLSVSFPDEVFSLLTQTVQDKTEWIRVESARTLAYYFDHHTDDVIVNARSLTAKGTDPSVYKLISQQAAKPVVRSVFQAFVALFFDLNETNVQVRLGDAVRAFEGTENIKYAAEIQEIYRELYHLHRMRNIDEIARYKYSMNKNLPANMLHFEETLQTFNRLNSISYALGLYLKRDGLGDRLASLLDAITAIEALLSELEDEQSSLRQHQAFSERLFFELLLKRWRTIVTIALTSLRGNANLSLELETKAVKQEEVVSIWLSIHNDGNSPADNVKVTLKPGDDFSVLPPNPVLFETIPSRDITACEFTLSPRSARLHLIFELTYSDANSKEETLSFGERLEIYTIPSVFQRIHNPYIVGTPIRNKEMFYGREDVLAFLSENLTTTDNNVTVVLYGQRRSGKTSLLNQLVHTSILDPHIPVYIDMQDNSLDITTAKFLRNIAYTINQTLKLRGLQPAPLNIKDFLDDPTFTLNLFLDDVETILGTRKLVIIIDEIDVLDQKVSEKAISREIFAYLRSLMQHRQGINFLLSGVHTIEQLTAGYWSVFFNIALHRKLSKLDEAASIRLITKPVKELLEYDPFAIKKIQRLTADQPYLVQLICQALVNHCNLMQKNYVTINDVNTVLREVMQTGEIHIKWIWDQTSQEEKIVLSILAEKGGEEGRLLSLADIKDAYTQHGLLYNHKKVLQALYDLTEKDFVEAGSQKTHFRVLLGLSLKWLRATKPLRRVMLEENLLIQE